MVNAPGADEIARRMGGAQAAVGGSLEVVLGRVARHLDRQAREHDEMIQLLNVVPIAGILTATGTLDNPDMLGPKDGYWWDLRRLTLSGFSAGTVALYRNSANGAQLANWTQTGEWTWSAAQWLRPRDRMIFVATGITGAVIVDGDAVEVSTRMLPQYVL